MDIRYAIHPDQMKSFDTQALRKHFLVEGLFERNKVNMVYSHVDRIIVGGICPTDQEVGLQVTKELGVDFFLQRREVGIINVGSKGTVSVDGKEYDLENKECLYIGMGLKEVLFKSSDRNRPAKFYFNSAPAHAAYPLMKLTMKDVQRLHLGAPEKGNVRTINQFVHPSVLKTCQLVMGLTMLEPNSMWNTMPCHTHDRRMEVYFYFDLPEDAVVFHIFGEPHETRHLVVRNEQAVISPSWSIHSGVGTSHYSFIWGLVGEYQTFTDMDDVPMPALK
ncbi:MAG: 4-deoxy-L-threo-5-hexosulose-uronate ketol-isomerase [Deltaproteobacteria bacterium]|nr:4-deoxy-L-threo-5-hexosulose-uronate ketol-isomerase [Deltaproteobacteria bacterium]